MIYLWNDYYSNIKNMCHHLPILARNLLVGKNVGQARLIRFEARHEQFFCKLFTNGKVPVEVINTLPETNIAPENRTSQKETSIPTIHVQVRTVSFREGSSFRQQELFGRTRTTYRLECSTSNRGHLEAYIFCRESLICHCY